MPSIPSKGGQNDQPDPPGGLEETLLRLTVPSPHLRGPRKLGLLFQAWVLQEQVLRERGLLLRRQREGSGVRVSAAIFRRRLQRGSVPAFSSLAARPRPALFTQGEFPPPPHQPQAALPPQPSECLLTHPEKASIMARRLPPPEEFRGAGPAGR